MDHESKGGAAKAIGSLILGLLGLLAWCLPIVGLPITATGLGLGIAGLNSNQRAIAIIGIVLSTLGLIATLMNAAVGAYLGATGQHPLLNQ